VVTLSLVAFPDDTNVMRQKLEGELVFLKERAQERAQDPLSGSGAQALEPGDDEI
jgi:hypothetical protein